MASRPEHHAAGNQSSVRPSWSMFRSIPVAVLILAAAMKAVSATQILASEGLLASPRLLFPVIGGEVAVAFLLIMLPIRGSRLVGLVAFTVLAFAAGYATATQQSCQCFGSSVSPHYMLLIDLGILFLTWVSRPGPAAGGAISGESVGGNQSPRLELSSIRHAVIASVIVGTTAATGAFAYHKLSSPSPVEFLLAETLRGQTWPVTAQYNPKLTELETGKWLVLVVRPDCEHCGNLVAKWFADPERQHDRERTATFHATDGRWSFFFDNVTLSSAELTESAAIVWGNGSPFVAAPAVFVLDDGMVVDAADASETDALLVKHFSGQMQ
jgi:hypothetical protein